MLDYQILGRGRVTYDFFDVDMSIPMVDQAQNLIEDLLQVEYENGVVLDVGWWPNGSTDGACWVTVVTSADWRSPRFERSATDYQEIVGLIRIGAKVAEWLAGGDETVSLTMYIDSNPGVSAPTRAEVLDALLAMNGRDNTLTCLEGPDGRTLMIGGGNDGRFLVDYLVDPKTQQNHVLIDPALAGPAVELCCGGQASEYPSDWCVGLGLALDATHYYCGTGGMAPHLDWVEG